QGEIDGHGGLADAALARSDGDDVLDPRDRLHALLGAVRGHLGGDLHGHLETLTKCSHCVGDLAPQGVVPARSRVIEGHIDRNLRAVDIDALDQLRRHDVAAGVGIDDVLQRRLDGGFGNFGHKLEVTTPSDGFGFLGIRRGRNVKVSGYVCHTPGWDIIIRFYYGNCRRSCPCPPTVERFSSPVPCPMPTGRSTSGTCWSTSRPISGCASSACAATRSTTCAPTTPTARR